MIIEMKSKLFSSLSSQLSVLFKPNLVPSSGIHLYLTRFSSSVLFPPPCVSSMSILTSQPSKAFTQRTLILKRFKNKYVDRENLDQVEAFQEEISYDKLTVDMFKELVKSNSDVEKIERILSEYEIIKYETGQVPSTLTVENMIYLLALKPNKRDLYFTFLFSRELAKYRKRKDNRPLPVRHPHLEVERDAGKKQIMGVRFDEQTGSPLYGEWLNSHFVRLRKSELSHSLDSNLIASYMFGPKLVIDCDYDLNLIEAKRIAWDIFYSLRAISQQPDPFNLILTGPITDPYKSGLSKAMTAFDPALGYLAAQIKDEHFLELFPKDKIIYLSPYSENLLDHYDHEAIYVLGGLPDMERVTNRLGSLKKVKRFNLKSYRLPLDQHFVFKSSKRLTLFECINILDSLSMNNDIAAALKRGVNPIRYKTQQELGSEAINRTERILKKSFRDLRKFT